MEKKPAPIHQETRAQVAKVANTGKLYHARDKAQPKPSPRRKSTTRRAAPFRCV